LITTQAFKKIAVLDKRIKAIQGGTSASKTYSILQQWIMKAYRNNPKFAGVNSIVAESMPHLKRGAMRDFFSILNKDNLYSDKFHNKSDSIYTINNSIFEFFSADQDDRLRGARRQNLFINECNNISYNAYTELEIRTEFNIWLDYNPVAEFYVHNELIGTPDVDFIKLTYKDNSQLSPNIIKSIESRMKNENWWKVYGLGEVGSLDGIVFSNYQIIDSVPSDARLLGYGLDFGFTNDPTTIIAVWYMDGRYIADEICYLTGLTNQDISRILLGEPRSIVICDSAEPKSIRELQLRGLVVKGANKGKGSVNYGIDLIKSEPFSVTKRSTNLIKELRNYQWKVDKEGKSMNVPIDIFNHGIDALRYFISEHKTVKTTTTIRA